MKKSFALRGRIRDRYLELVSEFPLTSIKSDEHLTAAQTVLDRLLARGQLSGGDLAYLDALSDLVAAYEDEHHAIRPPSDAEMLLHLLEAKGITQTELSRATRIAKSTVSEIVSGKRPFSRSVIRKLADYFRVDVGVLAANV